MFSAVLMTAASAWWMRRAADERSVGGWCATRLGRVGRLAKPSLPVSESPAIHPGYGRGAGHPVTAHIAIGTDIIHQHPTTDGAVLEKQLIATSRRLRRCARRKAAVCSMSAVR